MRDIYLVLGNSLVHYLGDTQTSFSSDVDIKLDLKQASVFATYDALNNVLLVDGSQITEDELGLWKISAEVTYSDARGRRQSFASFFYLHIVEREDMIPFGAFESYDVDYVILGQEDAPGVLLEQETRLDRPIPYIESLSPTGLMTIGWDSTMIVERQE